MKNENQIIFVVKGVIINAGKVLILKRAEDEEVGGGTWETVGGKIEFGEEIEAALIREINEETGLTVTVDKILYATTFKTDPTRQIILLAYLCHSESPDITLSAEHSDFKWAAKEQLELLLHPEIIKDFEQNNVFSALGV